MSAETANNLLGFASATVFSAVGVAALLFWRRRRDHASLWAALCFGTLGSVALVGQVLPETATFNLELVLQRVTVIALLLFPYLLYRFTTAFDPSPRWLDWSVMLAT